MIRVTLSETETFNFFEQTNTSILVDSPLAKLEIDRWDLYSQKKLNHNYKTTETACQTPICISVNKSSQRTSIMTKDESSSCSPKEMYADLFTPSTGVKYIWTNILQLKSDRKIKFYLGDFEETGAYKVRGIDQHFLLLGLRQIERVLNFNKNKYLLRLYARPNSIPPLRVLGVDETPKLRLHTLLSLSSDKSLERESVNCFTLCQGCKWMILLGSGEMSYENHDGGWLTCWNLKNLYKPEFRIPTESSVVCVTNNPNAPDVCAIGFFDGSVQAYRVASTGPKLIFSSKSRREFRFHYGPVWQLSWRHPKLVHSKPSKGALAEKPSFKYVLGNAKKFSKTQADSVQYAYPLISASEDGTLKEWLFNIETGLLTASTIIQLSFSPILTQPFVCMESLSAFPMRSPAKCISFKPESERELIIGTESGVVYLWHTYNNHAPSFTFEGHSTTVTSISWWTQPCDIFKSSGTNVFLTSSLEGSVKIWRLGTTKHLKELTSHWADTRGYTEASWCPWLQTVVMGVHKTGLHFWDVSRPASSPLYCFNHWGITSAQFSPHSRTILISNMSGELSIFRLSGYGDASSSILKLTDAVRKLVNLDPFR